MDDDTQPGGEIWQVIPDTEGRYEVSDLGRVRSLVVGCQHGSIPRKQPLVMSPFNNKRGDSGYWVINLRVGGRVKCRCVSELVLTAFVGPRPSPMHDAAHVDGDRNVNRLDNLQWATKKQNAAHKRLHGTHRPRPRCTSWAAPRGGGGISSSHMTEFNRNEGGVVVRGLTPPRSAGP
ncbi:MAG TPA: NUMOD4 domain-containing protein [Tepidisphaeraceae bacterium]|nr:NUMOD4 domain-containing protein [Tepidisphaeraceae bacterium]